MGNDRFKTKKRVVEAQEIARAKKTRYFKGYRQFYAGNNTLIIPSVQKSWDKQVIFTTTEEELNTFFPDIQGRFLEKSKTVAEKNGRPDTSKEFEQMYEIWGFRDRDKKIEAKKQIKSTIVKTTKQEERQIDQSEIETYFDACMLIGFQKLDFKDVKVHDPFTSKSKSPDNISIWYKYTSCPLDLKQDTLEEALTSGTFNKHHVKGECWINLLMGFYGDSILNPDKKKNIITKKDVLTKLNKTEEDLQEGLCVEDIIPFFEKFSVPLRVLNLKYQCIYKYDPEKQNTKISCHVCFMY